MSYAILPALESKVLDRVVVSTDSPEYAEVAKKYGAEVPFLRGKELSEDVPSEFVIIDAVKRCQKLYNEYYEIVVTLQCTTPLIIADDIIQCVNILANNEYDIIGLATNSPVPLQQPNSVMTVKQATESYPEWMFRSTGMLIGAAHELKPVMAGNLEGDRGVRQNLQPTYVPNGACYATRVPHLLTHRRLLVEPIYGILMPTTRSIDIDSEEDFLLCEGVLNHVYHSG